MSAIVDIKNNDAGPLVDEIAVIATTTTHASTDLADSGQLGDLATSGETLEMVCDGGDLYFFFASATGGEVDPTATSGSTRGYMIKDGEPFQFVPYKDGATAYTWITHECSAASKHIRVRVLRKP